MHLGIAQPSNAAGRNPDPEDQTRRGKPVGLSTGTLDGLWQAGQRCPRRAFQGTGVASYTLAARMAQCPCRRGMPLPAHRDLMPSVEIEERFVASPVKGAPLLAVAWQRITCGIGFARIGIPP